MAPLGSPEPPQSRFSSAFCSSSMAPPTSGFGFDMQPHLQRQIQSSPSPNEDTGFQRAQQVPQYYLPRRQQASQNGVSAPLVGAHDAAELMVKHDPQLGQSFQSFLQENMSDGAASNLMRYNSAPSSMLGSPTVLGNSVLNGDLERNRFLSNGDLHLESKKAADPSHEALSKGSSADRLSNHGTALPSPYASYRRAFDTSNGDLLSQMSMDVEGTPLLHAPDGLSDAGRTGLEVPSSFHLRSSFATSSAHLEADNGVVHGAAASKNSLLRHSSSPAGFLSQLNDDHERHLLGSSSGNSSEEGSYEIQGRASNLGKLSWDEAGNGLAGSPSAAYAARKRIRDLEQRGFSQKRDGLEPGVLGNYFGLPSTSPENTYFADKMSPDSIPCRARAKRGCATHPRSIAERVRRTKISERMKKLQELVPNMDKQTNTAEMLDEAVEYVKDLQRQVQELTESRSRCECSCRVKEASSK